MTNREDIADVSLVARYERKKDRWSGDTEDESDYVRRMQSDVLPDWPAEVLVQWLYQNAGCLDRYAFLFESLVFTREEWESERLPGLEAFYEPENWQCDAGKLADDASDRLPSYLIEHGTWPFPIFLLENLAGSVRFPDGEPLNTPYHLLEGHTRLSYFQELRRQGRVNPTHIVWVARIRGAGAGTEKGSDPKQ